MSPRRILCLLGRHAAPNVRQPHGPIVADCPCCGRTTYYYPRTGRSLSAPPVISGNAYESMVQPRLIAKG